MIPTIETLRRAGEILQEIENLQKELTGLFGGSAASASVAVSGKKRGRPPGGGGKRRTMSTEARARIAAAAKARWAKYRADKKGTAK